jgi:hypothetical protein
VGDEKMSAIIITKDGQNPTLSYKEEQELKLKPSKYYYVSENNKKTYLDIEKGENKGTDVGLARLAIQIFEEELDKLPETERNKLTTDAQSPNVGIWKDKNKFIEEWKNPKANSSNRKKERISVNFIKSYKNGLYYFYNCGLFDSLKMCESLMRYFKYGGKFVVEFNNNDDFEFIKEKAENEEEDNIKKNEKIPETEKFKLLKARRGQGDFRQKILKKFDGKCLITKVNEEDILIASHIKPWKDSTKKEKLSEENGLLLTPTYDKLFDRGFISFEDNGEILLSSYIKEANFKILNLTKGAKYDIKITEEMKRYLKYHREWVFKDKEIEI